MNRNEAREQAFTLLFSEIFSGDSSAESIIDAAVLSGEYQENEFTLRLLRGVIDKKTELDSLIESKLAGGWKLERLPKTTLAVLRLAVYEIMFCDDIPDAVSINEAVELVKKYGAEKDYMFVNGILGNISRGKE